MIPLESARARVLELCGPIAARSVPIGEAVGCVTTEPVVATDPVPAFVNSAMDGFAVRADDTAGADDLNAIRFDVIDTVNAGAVSSCTVGPGEAVRIMTGAPMPAGADAVVMVECSRPIAEDAVELIAEVVVGQSVRPAGGDVMPGDEVLPAGTVIRPAHLGVLASVGRAEVVVVPRPRVGVISTGDELVPAGEPLGPGQIHDSNRIMLLALVAEIGAEPVDLGHVPDDEERLAEVLRAAVPVCDVILTSGGVSMGDADVVKLVLGRIAEMEWMQVAIRPAKPFALGVLDGTPIIGLPGNPVSSLVSFELLARPGIRSRAGRHDLDRPRVVATSAVDLPRRPDLKTHYLRVNLARTGDGYTAHPVTGQGSHQLADAAGADGLAVLVDGDGLPAGHSIDVILLADAPPT